MDTTRLSSISVAVRVRPFTPSEQAKLVQPPPQLFHGDGTFTTQNATQQRHQPRGLRKIVNVVDDKMLIFDPPETNPLNSMDRRAFKTTTHRIRDSRFVFDHLFDEHATQQDVFDTTTRPLLDSVLDGFNATVFAYGATGCGKTHTILGSIEQPGVIFLTMEQLYQKIDLLEDTKHVNVTVLFLEIYNETIRDLLCPETPPNKLIIREDSSKRIAVANLRTRVPKNVHEVMDIITAGNMNRTLSPTEANVASSRSHAVLQINITSRDRTASLNEEHTYATLLIIDLAGSERAAATRNRGARLAEGANINKSLLALGNCINALCDPRRRNHVPYRNSKLTRLLQFSLGGNCKTVMIVCISPLSQHYDETLNTLKYADRAKEIKTKLVRNRHNLDRHVGSYLKMITEQKQEIDDLRSREARVIATAQERVKSAQLQCLNAIRTEILSMGAAIERQSHEKWRKYFLLAKRKLLLVHFNAVTVFLEQVQQKRSPFSKSSNLLVQAEQLQAKANDQIVELERQYDEPSELDMITDGSVSFTLKKLQELDGWSDSHKDIYLQLVELVKSRLDRDIMVNSSVLFDYLLDECSDYDYHAVGLGKIAQLTVEPASDLRDYSQALNDVAEVIELLNNSDYDAELETLTTRFMRAKMASASELAAPATAKRPTSPARVTRPIKTLRTAETSMNFESDVSIDDSAIHPKSEIAGNSPMNGKASVSMLEQLLTVSLPPPASTLTSGFRPESRRKLVFEGASKVLAE